MNQILDDDLDALGNKYVSMARDGKSYEEIKELVKADGWKDEGCRHIMREVDDIILNQVTTKSNRDALRVLNFAYYFMVVLGFVLFLLLGFSFLSVIFIGGGVMSSIGFINFMKSYYK